MFIEIRSLIKAKKYLDLKYDISSKNKLSNMKYSHLIDCLNILKFYNIKNYLRYGPAVLLHDIGRFYEEDSELAKFNHAEYGYNLLKNEFTDNPIILFPVKYHEEDIEWEKLICNDLNFLNCSKGQKRKIMYGCKLVRDIDIISNMKNLARQNLTDEKVEQINEKIIDNLYNGDISVKEDILNKFDEISYILCGLNLISYSKSFKYIRKYKIVEMLIDKQLKIVPEDKKIYDSTIEMYKFIKVKFKL